jgi:hypothetical protein
VSNGGGRFDPGFSAYELPATELTPGWGVVHSAQKLCVHACNDRKQCMAHAGRGWQMLSRVEGTLLALARRRPYASNF